MPLSIVWKLVLMVVSVVVVVVLLFMFSPGLVNKIFAFVGKGSGNGVTEAKILYIKMDPDGNGIWDFYLTDEKEQLADKQPLFGDLYFYNEWFLPSSLPTSRCVIYTVDREGGFLGVLGDKGYYYYVNAGVRLQTYNEEGTEYGSIKDCLGNDVTKNCIGKTVADTGGCIYGGDASMEVCRKTAEEFAFVNCRCDEKVGKCDDKLLIETEPFGEDVTPNGDCKDNKVKCNLLVEGKYEIKYGLICDDKGIWQPCTQDKATGGDKTTSGPYTIPVGGNDFTCCQSSQNSDVFIWKPGETC